MEHIRRAVPEDLEAIVDIYNYAIKAKFETAETTVTTADEKREWFDRHSDGAHPIFVSVVDGKVVGWISISPYRQGRQAVRFTVEISYYVHPAFKGSGIGSSLMAHCLEQSRKLDYKTLFAIVIDNNAASFGLLKKWGFKEWGRFPRAVDFEGTECDHVYYGLKL